MEKTISCRFKRYRYKSEEMLSRAISLTTPRSLDEDISKYNERLNEGLAIFNKLCMTEKLNPENKVKVLTRYRELSSDCADDMLCRWRDSLPFLSGDKLKNCILSLKLIAASNDFPAHERLVTSVCLYNNGRLDDCYHCLSHIARDKTLMYESRLEAVKFLYNSEDQDLWRICIDVLLEIIRDKEIPSPQRYKVIGVFISKTGIVSNINSAKLKVAYCEPFVLQLQSEFFFNETNDDKSRILSGQHLLQMKCVDNKDPIVEKLFGIIEASNSENTKADAADVICRLGDRKSMEKAKKLINDLGYSSFSRDTKGEIVLTRKTVYTNSQNIHYFTDQAEDFFLKLADETMVTRSYTEINDEICNLVRTNIDNSKDRFKIFQALNRISLDTATFTSRNLSTTDILVKVWEKICKDENCKELQKRMLEELGEMADTCSTGHAIRFVNVLAGKDLTLEITWEQQIISNIVGRINARMRDHPSAEIRAKLTIAQTDIAEDEDIEEFNKFISTETDSLRKELFEEFKEFVSEDEFNSSFEKGMNRLKLTPIVN